MLDSRGESQWYDSQNCAEPHGLHIKSRYVSHNCLFFSRTNRKWLKQPYEAIQARARKDHTSFSWFFNDWDLVGASSAAVQQEVAIVFLQSDSGEDYITVDGNEGDRYVSPSSS